MYQRSCPKCKTQISYKTKASFLRAEKKLSICRSCICAIHNVKLGKLRSERKIPGPTTGLKLSESHKAKLKISSTLNNAMRNGGLYPLMLKKHGEILGKEKIEERSRKLSVKFSGKNNPMYGKPSPMGSGYGWQGWYKGWRFRSLLELSFVINVLERFHFQWQSAEQRKFAIPYIDFKGQNRTYFPDFIVENRWLIEVKPSWMKNTVSSKLKASAAKDFCKQENLKYRFFDPGKMSNTQIKHLHDNGEIKFDKRYEKKWLETQQNYFSRESGFG